MDSLVLHMVFLPGMHVGMLAGGLLAIPSLRMLRAHCGRYLCSLFAQNLMCSGWMLVGMTTGALWVARWQAGLVRWTLNKWRLLTDGWNCTNDRKVVVVSGTAAIRARAPKPDVQCNPKPAWQTPLTEQRFR